MIMMAKRRSMEDMKNGYDCDRGYLGMVMDYRYKK